MRARLLAPLLAVALLAELPPGLAPIGTAVAGERDCRYDRRGRRHCRERGLSTGEVLLGAAAVAGVIALLASDDQRDERVGDDWGFGEQDARLAAVDACAEVAEREARQFGRSSRVLGIHSVERFGNRFEVRGAIEVDTRGGWDEGPNRDLGRADGDEVAFICLAGRDRVSDFRWDRGDDYVAL